MACADFFFFFFPAQLGCSHLIVGRDHAAPANGFIRLMPPRKLCREARRRGVRAGRSHSRFKQMLGSVSISMSALSDHDPSGSGAAQGSSGTELRERFWTRVARLPDWFHVSRSWTELPKAFRPPRDRTRITIFSLASSVVPVGKSTVAKGAAATNARNGTSPRLPAGWGPSSGKGKTPHTSGAFSREIGT